MRDDDLYREWSRQYLKNPVPQSTREDRYIVVMCWLVIVLGVAAAGAVLLAAWRL